MLFHISSSYNRWYYEGFGTDNEAYSGSDANTQQNSYYGYRRQSTFLGSEAGSGYYGETGSLVEHEGETFLFVLSILRCSACLN